MTGTRAKRDYLYSLIVEKTNLISKNLFLNQRVGCFRFFEFQNKEYLNYLIKDLRILEPVFESSTGAANQANIGITALQNILVPLPPLSEQLRIVKKLEQLMQLCDGLEQSITQSQQQNEMLLQQVLREALEPGELKSTHLEIAS